MHPARNELVGAKPSGAILPVSSPLPERMVVSKEAVIADLGTGILTIALANPQPRIHVFRERPECLEALRYVEHEQTESPRHLSLVAQAVLDRLIVDGIVEVGSVNANASSRAHHAFLNQIRLSTKCATRQAWHTHAERMYRMISGLRNALPTCERVLISLDSRCESGESLDCVQYIDFIQSQARAGPDSGSVIVWEIQAAESVDESQYEALCGRLAGSIAAIVWDGAVVKNGGVRGKLGQFASAGVSCEVQVRCAPAGQVAEEAFVAVSIPDVSAIRMTMHTDVLRTASLSEFEGSLSTMKSAMTTIADGLGDRLYRSQPWRNIILGSLTQFGSARSLGTTFSSAYLSPEGQWFLSPLHASWGIPGIPAWAAHSGDAKTIEQISPLVGEARSEWPSCSACSVFALCGGFRSTEIDALYRIGRRDHAALLSQHECGNRMKMLSSLLESFRPRLDLGEPRKGPMIAVFKNGKVSLSTKGANQ